MKLQESEGVSRRYINQYAMVAALTMPQNFIGILGRASAKTTQFQAMRIQQAVMECPGAPFVWVCDTYSNLHKNVIPSVLEGLRFLGWEMDVEFVIDRQPPIEWQRQMYNVIDKYKQVMTFWNGFTFTFVSLDRPSIGAGRSYVGLFGDEVKYWPEVKFTNIRKAVRGYRARYGDSPWYRSLSLTTDMPNPNHLGVDDITRPLSDNIIDSMIIDIEASYQAANQYSLFQGITTAGYEGGWYGFKRTDNKSSYALVFIGTFGLCQAIRNGSGNWFLYRMSNSIY